MRDRIKTEITEEMSGRCVKEILVSELLLTRHQISSAKFRDPGICLNGKKCRITEKVKAGDLVEVYLEHQGNSEEQDIQEYAGRVKRCPIPLSVCYEDEDILVVNKPAGMATHPGHGHHQDTLANAVAAYLGNQGGEVHAVGRLDKDTSGLVVFAKHRIAAARLSDRSKDGKMKKIYLALAEGELDQGGSQIGKGVYEINMPMMREDRELNKMIPVTVDPSHLSLQERKRVLFAKTLYTVAEHGSVKNAPWDVGIEKKYTVILAHPVTGRTHQIRVHMAGIGHPLLWDTIYGSKEKGAYDMPSAKAGDAFGEVNRVALHCMELYLTHPMTRERLCIYAPLPYEMTGYVDLEGVRRASDVFLRQGVRP